jgi:Flp pilus assembly protein TadG
MKRGMASGMRDRSFDRRRDGERGSAAIEAAIVTGLLLLIVLGSFEWGMALRDWVTVSSATREGARAAASAGSIPGADCRILEAAAGSLQNIPSEAVVEIWIYKSDPSGSVGATHKYRPQTSSDTETVDLTCTSGWFLTQDGWPASARVDTGPSRDWVGVRVVFDHEWRTDFLWFTGTARWEDETVMRIEPDVS